MRNWLIFCVATLLATSYARPASASGISPQSRMAIIRGLTAEYANLKVPLPRGKKGLVLNTDGKVDEDSLRHEITQNGTAVAAHTLVQITAIAIQNKQIFFEINGGSTKK